MGRQGYQKVRVNWQLNEMRMAAIHSLLRSHLFIDSFSRFIKGFITRNQPACIDNSEYLAYVRQNYLTRLRESLPKTVLEKDSWLTPPPIMQEVSGTFLPFNKGILQYHSNEDPFLLHLCLFTLYKRNGFITLATVWLWQFCIQKRGITWQWH